MEWSGLGGKLRSQAVAAEEKQGRKDLCLNTLRPEVMRCQPSKLKSFIATDFLCDKRTLGPYFLQIKGDYLWAYTILNDSVSCVILLCRLFSKGRIIYEEETSALCHRRYLWHSLLWVVSVECITLSPASRGWKYMNSSEKCLNAGDLRQKLPLLGLSSFGFLATCLLPWCRLTQAADLLPCGM